MHIDWSAYRITLLLYLGVFILPLSFYFSYSSFREIQIDTKVLNRLTLSSASMLTLDENNLQIEKTIKSIDEEFVALRPWMIENNDKNFYIASIPLLQKYDAVVKLWKSAQKGDKQNLLFCFKEAKSLIFSLSNMLELKQNKIYNLFYINLFIAMALFFTLIFLTRVYIHGQLLKHAVYDLKTQLYTKNYLLATLKEVRARTIRNKEPLSALYIIIEDLKEQKNL